MPKTELQPQLATTTEQDITLTPQQRAALELEFHVYESLVEELAETQAAVDVSKAELARLRETLGVKSVGFGGYRITRTKDSETNKLDRKKLLAQGVLQSQLDKATVKGVRKGHELITLPGDAAKDAKKPQRSYNDEGEE